jgi:4'-phosphopantetheinyl transferase
VKPLQVSLDQETSIDDAPVMTIGLAGLLACRLKLAPGEVHLWRAPLADHVADGYKHLLSGDELSRAARFHFAKDRNHFIAGRALLRLLLATYSGIDAAELQFSYAEKGKPALVETQRNSIDFNLAHSHGLALFAFAKSRAVGVDLEFMREDLADQQIATRFFSPHEVEALSTVAAESKREAFFNCWTRKEAYIKARGDGLSLSLAGFDVSLRPDEPAVLLRNYKEPAEPGRWTMRAIPMPSGYVAALVVAGQDFCLRSFALE